MAQPSQSQSKPHTPPQSSALATVDKATEEIEQVLANCNAVALREMPMLKQAVVLASGITQLRAVLTEEIMTRVFLPLMGSALGFQTDRDDSKTRQEKGDYPMPVVRDALIEGMIKGLRPVNNELNIISGRAYAAKAGLTRLVAEFPGLTDLRIVPGVPQNAGDKGALVAVRANWRLHGQTQELVRDVLKGADGVVRDTRIAVKVNAFMGSDAIIGKAIRKTLKAIYDQLTGSTLTIEDGECVDTTGEVIATATPSPAPVPPEQEARRVRMGGNGKKSDPQAAPAPATEPAAASASEPATAAAPASGREPGQEG